MRLFRTTVTLKSDMGGIAQEHETVRYTTDFEEVSAIREDEEHPGRCLVLYRDGDMVRVNDSYESVDAAWGAYRRAADAINRLRN